MLSMTGYGAGEAALGEGRTVVEVRALNHRYLEVRTSVSSELMRFAWLLEQQARKRLDRGRYDISARLSGPTPLSFELERARLAYRALCALRDEVAPGSEVPLSALAAMPDVFGAAVIEDDAVVGAALRTALDTALDGLDEMRAREGDALRVAMEQSLRLIRTHQREVVERTADASSRQRTKLRERIELLLRDVDVQIDPSRLEVELAIIADRIDVAEELTRLDSHLVQLEALFSAAEPIGRRLDFLLQEIARELNTLSAKCQDAAVSQLGVALKAEIARMRQQAQNIA